MPGYRVKPSFARIAPGRRSLAPIFWGLTYGAGVVDVVGKAPCTNSGGVSAASSPWGSASSYNGTTGYTDTGANIGNYDKTTPFSIGARIYPTLNSTDQVIFGNGVGDAATPQGYHLRITAGNRLRFILFSGSGSSYIGMDSQLLSAGWHDVWGIWDGTNTHVFVDGVDDSVSSIVGGTLGSIATSAHTLIGQSGDSGLRFWFNGLIDGVQSYPRALTAREIARSHANPWWLLEASEDEDDDLDLVFPAGHTGSVIGSPVIGSRIVRGRRRVA